MIMHWWIFIFFILTVLFSSVIFANPFDSFENELKDYIDSDSDTDLDPELKKLFQPDDKAEDSYRVGTYSSVSSNYKLPSHIKVSRLISTTVINKRGKSSGGSHYKVRAKDTLSAIAKRHHTSVKAIKSLNNLKSDVIRIGQTLRLNGGSSSPQIASSSKVYKMKVFAMPVLKGRVTSRYGYRKDPFNPNVKNFHSGLDLSAPVGTPVIAAADGIVEFKGRNGGYGNTVIIRHKQGYKTIYAHCSTTTVEIGEQVKMGTVIGSVGRTGTATGAHLHFEVMRRGKFVNPESALKKVEIVTAKSSGISGS